MKIFKTTSIFLLIIFFPFHIYSQYKFEWINPYPNGYKVNDLEFVDSSTGYALEHDIYFSRIVKTTNGGANWIVKDSSKLYLTKLDYLDTSLGYISSAHDVFKTINGSNSMVSLFSISGGSGGYIYKIYFTNSFKGFAIGYINSPFGPAGFSLKTSNGGANWFSALSYNFQITQGVTFYKDIGFIFGLDSNRLRFFWTDNEGGSWGIREFNLGIPNIYGYAIADSMNAFLLGINTIYKTTNQGINWFEQLRTDVKLNSIKFFNNTGFVVCDTGCYYKTTDKGVSWNFQNNLNTKNNLYSISFINQSEVWFGGEGGSTFKTTTNGQSWSTNSSNIIKNDLSEIDIIDSTIYIIGQPGKILKSSDGGKNFVIQNSNSTSTLSDIQFIDKLKGYICGNQIFLKTNNGGSSWQIINTGLSDHYFNLSFINENTGWIGSRYGKYLKTTNGGSNWQIINFINSGFITEIYFINENIGWIGSHGTKIYKTTDGGKNWVIQLERPSVAFIRKIKFLTPDIGAAVFDGGVALTTNGGINWMYNSNFGNHDHYDIDIIDSNRVIFVGSFGEIYYTNNFGMSWNRLDAYTKFSFGGIKFMNNHIAFTVGSRGLIMKLTSSNTIGINNLNNEISEQYILYQNYPNPFNPKTIINYQLSMFNFVSLKVYDALGKEVATLVNEKQNAGSYKVEFGGSAYPSGIYYYKLSAGEYSESRKMTLIK